MKYINMLVMLILGIRMNASLCATENTYALHNRSCVQIKVKVWFTNAIKGLRRSPEHEHGSDSNGIMQSALPVPDMQFTLDPHSSQTISDQEDVIQIGECLAYLVAEYRVIPSLVPALQESPVIPADLYLIGKRSWAQKLPGLCGINTIEMNYDPSTYLKFTIKINGVEDYFQDVSKLS